MPVWCRGKADDTLSRAAVKGAVKGEWTHHARTHAREPTYAVDVPVAAAVPVSCWRLMCVLGVAGEVVLIFGRQDPHIPEAGRRLIHQTVA